MSKLAEVLVSCLLVSLVSGCGAGGPRSDSAGDRPQDSTQAVSVTVSHGGGIAPTPYRLVFAAGEPPPPGHTRADVQAVLEAASDPALRRVEMTPLPENQCCDRQGYSVTITWDDGSSRTYRTLDGVEQPRIFQEFLSKAT